MFRNAHSFNQNIAGWNTSRVVRMAYMFRSASSFNQDLSSWDTSKVTHIGAIFDGASSLSSNNKGKIHESFSSNPNWPYPGWAAYLEQNQTNPGDSNGTNPDNNGTQVLPGDSTPPPPMTTLPNGSSCQISSSNPSWKPSESKKVSKIP